MSNRTSKNIRTCCFVALAFCLVWAVSMLVTFYTNMGDCYSSSCPIDWAQNAFKKAIVLSFYVVGTIATIALCVKIVINTLKGIRENNVFPKSNEKLLFWIALAVFVRLLGNANLALLWGDNLILAIVPENLIIPFFLLFFAFMYKVAADAVEENNLTI